MIWTWTNIQCTRNGRDITIYVASYNLRNFSVVFSDVGWNRYRRGWKKARNKPGLNGDIYWRRYWRVASSCESRNCWKTLLQISRGKTPAMAAKCLDIFQKLCKSTKAKIYIVNMNYLRGVKYKINIFMGAR